MGIARPDVSLVATVLNEVGSIDAWLLGLDRQRSKPGEIVIVDGGSTDGTWERLQSWTGAIPVRCERMPGANISAGRNRAIELASGEIIVATDAGTVARPDWLERLLAPFDDPFVDVVGGFFVPATASTWERALAAASLPDANEIDPGTFLPSSRSVAFRRSWFDSGIRYPEWLDYCEDLVFDLALMRSGARFHFEPGAVVSFRPRSTVGAFARQYYRYARGDGKAGLFLRRHLIRYGVYAGSTVVLARRRSWELFAAIVLSCLYIRQPIVRLWHRDRHRAESVASTATVLPLVVLARLVGDGAKMLGYPVGLAWRMRQFGSVGRRATWRSISPAGERWHPELLTRENRTPTSLPDGGSPAD